MKQWVTQKRIKSLTIYLLMFNAITSLSIFMMILGGMNKPRTMVCQMVSMRTIACADK